MQNSWITPIKTAHFCLFALFYFKSAFKFSPHKTVTIDFIFKASIPTQPGSVPHEGSSRTGQYGRWDCHAVHVGRGWIWRAFDQDGWRHPVWIGSSRKVTHAWSSGLLRSWWSPHPRSPDLLRLAQEEFDSEQKHILNHIFDIFCFTSKRRSKSLTKLSRDNEKFVLKKSVQYLNWFFR